MSRFTSSTLVDKIREQTGGSASSAEAQVDAVFRALDAVAKEAKHVRITGFGTFAMKHRAERQGRNPQTGEPVRIAARDALTFKPSKVG